MPGLQSKTLSLDETSIAIFGRKQANTWRFPSAINVPKVGGNLVVQTRRVGFIPPLRRGKPHPTKLPAQRLWEILAAVSLAAVSPNAINAF